jgi:hypothetical protein
LHEFHGYFGKALEVGRRDDGPGDQEDEDDEHDKVEDRVADDPSLSQLGLLERVNRWSNLTANHKLEYNSI